MGNHGNVAPGAGLKTVAPIKEKIELLKLIKPKKNNNNKKKGNKHVMLWSAGHLAWGQHLGWGQFKPSSSPQSS